MKALNPKGSKLINVLLMYAYKIRLHSVIVENILLYTKSLGYFVESPTIYFQMKTRHKFAAVVV